MARVTVEDCVDKVESPYELVLVAKERATQLNSGIEPTLERDDDKHTVIALREIAEENVKVSDLSESAVYEATGKDKLPYDALNLAIIHLSKILRRHYRKIKNENKGNKQIRLLKDSFLLYNLR